MFYRFLPPIDRCDVIRVPKLDTKITAESIFDLPNYDESYKNVDHSARLADVQRVPEE